MVSNSKAPLKGQVGKLNLLLVLEQWGMGHCSTSELGSWSSFCSNKMDWEDPHSNSLSGSLLFTKIEIGTFIFLMKNWRWSVQAGERLHCISSKFRTSHLGIKIAGAYLDFFSGLDLMIRFSEGHSLVGELGPLNWQIVRMYFMSLLDPGSYDRRDCVFVDRCDHLHTESGLCISDWLVAKAVYQTLCKWTEKRWGRRG